MTLNIPVLDANRGLDDDQFIEALAAACEEWGFFQIIGHGIDLELRRRFFSGVEDFFALPKDTKLALSRTENNIWGYYDKELTKNRVDAKEIYDIDGNIDLSLIHISEPTRPY